MRLALAMIVKGSDEEAENLKRCLNSVAPHVDGIFITITQPNEYVKEVAEVYGATVSEYQWNNNFADARNFNFSQVPKIYTHILWADADDTFDGLEKLKPTLEDNPQADAFAMFYQYQFNEYNQPIVVHQKTMVVKNNGCVEWMGALHEDFKTKRQIRSHFIKGIVRIHHKTDEAIDESRDRNYEIALQGVKDLPNDPRSFWNLGNAAYGAAKYEEAKGALMTFMKMSSSEEEKYVTNMRLASVAESLGNPNDAVDYLRAAIGIRPRYPDAYHALGYLFYNLKRYRDSADMFIEGLVLKPPYFEIVAYNPRDYDYNPMLGLSKAYFALNRPDLALPLLEGVFKIAPDDNLENLIKEMKKEVKKMDKAIEGLKKIANIKDDKKFLKEVDKLDPDVQSHPMVWSMKNQRIIKKESSGKDLVIYCGMSEIEWSPGLFEKKGFGGSEEAVIHLSRQLAKQGWTVTVYASCGHKEKDYDGVMWRPFWQWNYRDKQDVLILWRIPKALDYEIGASKVFVDVHDALDPGEFTPERVEKMTKMFVKTEFHRSLYPDVPDDKIAIVPNGVDFSGLDVEVERDPLLLVNTSSPDRHIEALIRLFKRVKEQIPGVRCKWAYGWDIFDIAHGTDPLAMEWKAEMVKGIKESGIEDVGRLPQHEVAKLYKEGAVYAYPTEFAEIDCISVKKAQYAGCVPVTTDFAALDESVTYGAKVHSKKTKDDWCLPFQFHFELNDEEAENEWVDAVVTALKEKQELQVSDEWKNKYSWESVGQRWCDIIKED